MRQKHGRGGQVRDAGEDDPVEALIARSRRLRRRGDRRGALVVLRQAASLDEWRARTYTLLGVRLAEAGRQEDAVKALGHARWLRQRAGEASRAAVTAKLLERARAGDNLS